LKPYDLYLLLIAPLPAIFIYNSIIYMFIYIIMHEYRVNFTEVTGECQNNETYGGVLIYIRPPVQLNPDAVERYFTYGDFEPVNRNIPTKNDDIKDVVVLGSTAEQTTIYVSIDRGYEDEVLANEVANKTVKLLHFMGATAIIDHPPTPEA